MNQNLAGKEDNREQTVPNPRGEGKANTVQAHRRIHKERDHAGDIGACRDCARKEARGGCERVTPLVVYFSPPLRTVWGKLDTSEQARTVPFPPCGETALRSLILPFKLEALWLRVCFFWTGLFFAF